MRCIFLDPWGKTWGFGGAEDTLKMFLLYWLYNTIPLKLFCFLSFKNSTFLWQTGKSNILSQSIFANARPLDRSNSCDLVYSIYQVHHINYRFISTSSVHERSIPQSGWNTSHNGQTCNLHSYPTRYNYKYHTIRTILLKRCGESSQQYKSTAICKMKFTKYNLHGAIHGVMYFLIVTIESPEQNLIGSQIKVSSLSWSRINDANMRIW